MDELTIGAFARRVGLTASALRFYDDCDVLKPSRVDDSTGYRYYRAEQETRAATLRDLRAAGLPLVETVTVLDSPPEQARAVLEAHLRRLRDHKEAAEAAVGRILARTASASVDGLELASAIRQVAPSVARDADFPALSCVLVELSGGELRLVATDRFRLAIRALHPASATGCGRALMPGAELTGLGQWASRFAVVTVEFEHARLRAGGDTRELSILDDECPAYREMLAALPPPRYRIVVDRLALRKALPEQGFVLRGGKDELAVGGRALPALCGGPVPAVAFDPRTLAPALETSVGPDVLLEIAGPAEPVTVRSADQGSFTTLVMPIRGEG